MSIAKIFKEMIQYKSFPRKVLHYSVCPPTCILRPTHLNALMRRSIYGE